MKSILIKLVSYETLRIQTGARIFRPPTVPARHSLRNISSCDMSDSSFIQAQTSKAKGHVSVQAQGHMRVQASQPSCSRLVLPLKSLIFSYHRHTSNRHIFYSNLTYHDYNYVLEMTSEMHKKILLC